jgi:phosphonate transport system substrate-binding protein
MAWVRFIVAGVVALSLFGGSGCERSHAGSHVSDAPTKLRIAFVPQVDMEERYAAAYRALETYLSAALELEVEVTQLESVNVALEGLRARKLDLCNFSPWPFLIAESKAGMEALFVTGAPDGNPVSYRTVLIARPELALSSMEDVKARASSLVFSFEEPVSTSGHLVPRTFFHEAGIEPERDFKQTLFSSDSTASILAVKMGRLDVAAVSDSGLARCIAKKRIKADDVSVVWMSPPVLANVVAIRRELPADFKRKVRDAFLRMPEAAPEEWAKVARQYSHPVTRYLPAEENLFARYREAVRTIPGLQIAL